MGQALGKKIAAKYFWRSTKVNLFFLLGIIHNWATAHNRVKFKDDDGEISGRAIIINKMNSYIRKAIVNKVTTSYKTFKITGNAVSTENWVLDKVGYLNVDFWLYKTATVNVKGSIEAKKGTKDGKSVICYRNLNTVWSWEDGVDANSFRESWKKGQYTESFKEGKYVQGTRDGIIGGVENITDLYEKIAGADFDIRVNWEYKKKSGIWFVIK